MDMEYGLKVLRELLAIDSPTGYTCNAAAYLMKELTGLGYKPVMTKKGGVIADLGGEDNKNGLVLASHVDTLGAMVSGIKADGRLRVTPLGGLNANNAEGENCRIVTKFNGVYEGTFQLANASVHVNRDYSTTQRSFDTVEVVIDEPVSTEKEVRELGIGNGDIVCPDPRTTITKSGYIKSRFLDDKLSAAVLVAYAKYLKENGLVPKRRVYIYFTVFEEVGHGGSASLPENVTEMISVDMGCVGEGLSCTERQVSICAKDSGGPYHYEVVKGLIEAAKRAGADYAVDIYPYYGSDVEATLKAGYDIRHGLIGPGVYASHGYERSHVDGAENTLKLIAAYTL